MIVESFERETMSGPFLRRRRKKRAQKRAAHMEKLREALNANQAEKGEVPSDAVGGVRNYIDASKDFFVAGQANQGKLPRGYRKDRVHRRRAMQSHIMRRRMRRHLASAQPPVSMSGPVTETSFGYMAGSFILAVTATYLGTLLVDMRREAKTK